MTLEQAEPVEGGSPDVAPPAEPALDVRGRALLVAVCMVTCVGMLAVIPIEDIDVYWHLLVGQDVLAGIPVAEAGRGWDFTAVPDTWVSTQWLAELAFAWLEQHGGLQALVLWRALGGLAIMLSLAAVTVWNRPTRVGVWVYAAVTLVVAMATQVRSLVLTYALAPLVGRWGERLWLEGRLPRWWVVLPVMVIWANTHGGWVILPMTLALAAAARALDHGLRDRAVPRALLLAVAATAATVISPAGIGTTLAVARFSGATATITEWKPVEVWDPKSIPLALLLVLTTVAWARGRVRPSRGELLLVLGLFAFSLTAWRSMPVACLTLAPILVGVLARAAGLPDPVPVGTPDPGRPVILGGAAIATVLALALPWVNQAPVGESPPVGLIAQVRDADAPQRVLNSYNVSGPLLWLGGRPPHVRVAIDGRADRWGAEWIQEHLDLLSARPGWEKTFDALDPTAALISTESPLSAILVSERGWVEVGREAGYVLLRAPDAPGWS